MGAADQFALGMGLAVVSAAVGAGAAKPRLLQTLERKPWIWVLAGLFLYSLLGLISYSFYLYHLAAIIMVDKIEWLHKLGWEAVTVAAFAASVATAAISYRLIEAPGIALGRRWAAAASARIARRSADA